MSENIRTSSSKTVANAVAELCLMNPQKQYVLLESGFPTQQIPALAPKLGVYSRRCKLFHTDFLGDSS